MKKQILLVVSILLLSFSIISAQTPKIISGGVLNGKATNLPVPEYPAAAKAVKAGGTVNVQVTIDENGSVTEASAVSGHPLLRSAAVDAARQANFSPTTLSGQAVKVTGVIVYNFTPSPVYTVSQQTPGLVTGQPVSDGMITGQSTANDSIKTISGGVVNGKARNLVTPSYPAAAKAVNASGAVNVQVTIDENGNVISADAISGHPLLRASSEKAARESKFSPTTLQGEPVRVTGVIIYNYLMPMSWVQIGYALSLAEKSLSVKDHSFSAVGATFPVDWTEEKADLEKTRDYLEEKLTKEKMQQKQLEQANAPAKLPTGEPMRSLAGLSAANMPKGDFTIRGTAVMDKTYQLDSYSAEMLTQLQSKIENRLDNTNKIFYFKFGKTLGKLIAEIDDDYKTSVNSQELNQILMANSSSVSSSFASSVNNIIEISTQNISVSDKKAKMLAVIEKLQDH